MSGGTYDYLCFKIEDTYAERTYDEELDEMIVDLAKVLHDLEWWQSGDIGEEDYRKTLRWFKDKWFGKRDENFHNHLKRLALKSIEELKDKIKKL
jgi:hypothetical protein